MRASLGLLALCLSALGGPPAGGPYHHQVLSASSPDGLNWTVDEGVRLEHASVPAALAYKGKIYLYFVDAGPAAGKRGYETAEVAVSEDGLAFEKRGLAILGLGQRKALDPAPLLLPEGGGVRLYYLAARRGPPRPGQEHEIHAADSKDGIRFRREATVLRAPELVDPDVFLANEKWHWLMYVFGRGGTRIAASKDGLAFTLTEQLGPEGWGTTAPVPLSDGKLRLYAFSQRQREANEIRSFIGDNGVEWEEEDGIRLRAPAGEQWTDPSVVRWKGGWKMYFKRDPRAGRR